MIITQIIEVPADRRVSFEFLAPQEIPAGKVKVEVKLTPVVDEPTDRKSEDRGSDPAPANAEGRATPISDSLFGILSGLGDINLEQIREERLAKYLK